MTTATKDKTPSAEQKPGRSTRSSRRRLAPRIRMERPVPAASAAAVVGPGPAGILGPRRRVRRRRIHRVHRALRHLLLVATAAAATTLMEPTPTTTTTTAAAATAKAATTTGAHDGLRDVVVHALPAGRSATAHVAALVVRLLVHRRRAPAAAGRPSWPASAASAASASSASWPGSCCGSSSSAAASCQTPAACAGCTAP
ncbi:hypothetical protein BT67DRAFT_22688 [Trichocladium antarcticum]|uniref:Uncharacterized protein n=1 Tax=Trichocladium antarcticum TaxID=1450529 RepID=A0AAN6ZIH6_9PEZI|nr:hypothetical protein BT67DRAFT_22688 [Trichocladium antarcticum]